MKLPQVDQPEKYVDLFVVDLGDGKVDVGYTADEVAALLEQEQYAGAKVYRIADASPDGSMELVGVPRERFGLEAGMFFAQERESPAAADYEELRRILTKSAPPCRCRLVLGHCKDWRATYMTGLIYPAECDQAVSRFLMDHDFRGGISVAAGTSIVGDFNRDATVLASLGFEASADRRGRGWEQFRAAVGDGVQR